jgi:hypothetical protein
VLLPCGTARRRGDERFANRSTETIPPGHHHRTSRQSPGIAIERSGPNQHVPRTGKPVRIRRTSQAVTQTASL